ncbi:MAG: sugar phosphate isomerase/epimerase family protein [Zavarzinella sp.]
MVSITFPDKQMKLAFSTNAYLRYSFSDAVTRLANIGYAAVEIMADVPHAWPAYMLPEQLDALKQALASNILEISNINAFMMHAISDPRQLYWFPSWLEPDPNYRSVRVNHTKRALTMARALGAKCITTEPGGPVAPGESWQEKLADFVETLKPVVEHAENEQVMLLVEPEPGLLIETTPQAEELMSHFNSPYFGLNFDIGHQYCVGEDPADSLKKLAKHVHHIHLEDIAETRVHHHLVPGTGAIDFASVLQAVKDIAYSGWVTIELYPYTDDPDAAARTALQHISKIAASIY